MSYPEGVCRCPFYKFDGAQTQCGCDGETCSGEVRLYKDQAVHFQDRHWCVDCAFYHLVAMVDRYEDALKMTAGIALDNGYMHASPLHDQAKLGRFVRQVLKGQEPLDAVKEL